MVKNALLVITNFLNRATFGTYKSDLHVDRTFSLENLSKTEKINI